MLAVQHGREWLGGVDTGALFGSIKDSSGAVLPGASVTTTNVETGVSTAVKTDVNGNHVLTPLKIGTYSISVEEAGFEKQVRNNIVLNVQQEDTTKCQVSA
jgi:hypothetical protein